MTIEGSKESIFVGVISNYQILSISHQTLDINEIGQFVIKHDNSRELAQRLANLKEKLGIEELLYLSTCNRVCFLMYNEEVVTKDWIRAFFSAVNPQLNDETLGKLDLFVNHYYGEKALSHLFELTSSLDSLVVGEREIYRQFRQSYQFAEEHTLVGQNIRLLEKSLIVGAKDVYARTKIGERSLSIVALAIEELEKQNPRRDAKILMIGAGDTNRLVTKFLKKRDYTNITIFNRSLDNAAALSESVNGKAYHLSQLASYSEGFDIIIACTGATQAVLTENIYKGLLGRDSEKKILVDLSVPRNIEAKIVACHDVEYIDIERLRYLAEHNLQERKKEIGVAKKILKIHIADFVKTYQQRQIQKLLVKVPQEIKAIKEKAINIRYKEKMESLDPDTKELVFEMMDYMERSFVAVPMKLAKEAVH